MFINVSECNSEAPKAQRFYDSWLPKIFDFHGISDFRAGFAFLGFVGFEELSEKSNETIQNLIYTIA